MEIKQLKNKIILTQLFTPNEKLVILLDMDNYDEPSLNRLEKVIDDFNNSYNSLRPQILKTFEDNINEIEGLNKDNPEIQAAITKIKQGLNTVNTNGNSQ